MSPTSPETSLSPVISEFPDWVKALLSPSALHFALDDIVSSASDSEDYESSQSTSTASASGRPSSTISELEDPTNENLTQAGTHPLQSLSSQIRSDSRLGVSSPPTPTSLGPSWRQGLPGPGLQLGGGVPLNTVTFPPATSTNLVSGSATPRSSDESILPSQNVATTTSKPFISMDPSSSVVLQQLLNRVVNLEDLLKEQRERDAEQERKALEREKNAARRHEQLLAQEKKRHQDILSQHKEQHKKMIKEIELQAGKQYTELMERIGNLNSKLHQNRADHDKAMSQVNSRYQELMVELEELRAWAVSGDCIVLLKLQARSVLDCMMKFLAPFMGVRLHYKCTNGEGSSLFREWLDDGSHLIPGQRVMLQDWEGENLRRQTKLETALQNPISPSPPSQQQQEALQKILSSPEAITALSQKRHEIREGGNESVHHLVLYNFKRNLSAVTPCPLSKESEVAVKVFLDVLENLNAAPGPALMSQSALMSPSPASPAPALLVAAVSSSLTVESSPAPSPSPPSAPPSLPASSHPPSAAPLRGKGGKGKRR
ncbi:hypothetical protein BJ912DRAFT_1062808 [Pholiota molesta]|nr:hypothetical protein BJ912DRAFT_1062808 [Pholiota molesta]